MIKLFSRCLSVAACSRPIGRVSLNGVACAVNVAVDAQWNGVKLVIDVLGFPVKEITVLVLATV